MIWIGRTGKIVEHLVFIILDGKYHRPVQARGVVPVLVWRAGRRRLVKIVRLIEVDGGKYSFNTFLKTAELPRRIEIAPNAVDLNLNPGVIQMECSIRPRSRTAVRLKQLRFCQ